MKTSNTTVANTASNTNARIHSILAIVGVAIAIICSLVVLNDQSSGSKEASVLSLSKTSIGTIRENILKAQDFSLISRIENIVNF